MYRLMPDAYKRKVGEWFTLAGIRRSPEMFTNYSFALSFALGFVAALLTGQYFSLVWAAVFIGSLLLFHGFVVLAVERRTGFLENILPDALQLMASNSRAGYIPSRAFIMSARPEFGPLSEAIQHAGKDVMTGMPLEEALKGMTRYVRSGAFERTIKLIIEGISSGGKFANLLEENAADLRRMQVIKKEMGANIAMYIFFIFFAGAIGAPMLYSMSAFLVNTLSSFGSVDLPDVSVSKIKFAGFGKTAISQEFMFQFSIAAMLVTAIFGSLIIGLISTGKESGGIKYIPFLVIASLAVYFITGSMIQSIFNTFLGTG
ncbi:MAG: type II secretion system F family protein [Candidatus Aenigmarchaeota archaeon]|nr:type II secretion system F family protein [Candidatus Aenigmarchaeota archaeon]